MIPEEKISKKTWKFSRQKKSGIKNKLGPLKHEVVDHIIRQSTSTLFTSVMTCYFLV